MTIRYHSPPATRGAAQPEIVDDRAAAAAEAAGARGDLDEEDGDIDANQDEGGGRRLETAKAAAPVVTRVRWRMHSGQRIPTGVGVMQSGQIGRPQDEQETPVSRSGCR